MGYGETMLKWLQRRLCGEEKAPQEALIILILRMVIWKKRIRESKCAADLGDIVEEMESYIKAAFS